MKNPYVSNHGDINGNEIYVEENSLPRDLKVRIENFANAMSEIAVDRQEFSKFDKFINKFSEDYGFNVEVPLNKIVEPMDLTGCP